MDADAVSTSSFDVIIAGGAMAGATLALALEKLTQKRLSIAVIEAAPSELNHPGFDARSIALAYGSCQLLDKIGIWQKLAPFATSINAIHVSDKGHFGMTEMQAQKEHLPYLGNVIELADAGNVFHQALQKSPSTHLFWSQTLTHIKRHESHVRVTLSNGKQLTAALLVAADGAISSCCQQLNIHRHEHDFGQIALIANISTEQLHLGRAFERFTQEGPIALLPMSDGRSSLVWCLSPSKANHLMMLKDEDFIEALQVNFGWRLGKITKIGKRHAYPLILRQSSQLISHRFAVVGNAAQTLHPIAGQGFNLGLRDVITLAEEISQQLTISKDCGVMPMLQAYLKRRKNDRDSTVAMTSGLVHGFSNQALPFILGRNLGLIAMTAHHSLKAPIIQRALGFVER